jgi:hypothetical protein
MQVTAAGPLAALRRRPKATAAVLLVAALGLGALTWKLFFAAPPEAVVLAPPTVPEHQRVGPLANPYGGGPAETGPDRAAAAPTTASSPAVADAQGSAAGRRAAPPSLDTPAAREALRAALAQWRSATRSAEYLAVAVQAREPAALVVAWMADRQCRDLAQWRQMLQWLKRAAETLPPGNAPAMPAVSPALRQAMERCEAMPEDETLDGALADAGFAGNAAPNESIRRPIELAQAAAFGDATLLAAVLEAAPPQDLVTWIAARPTVAQLAPQAGQATLPVLRGAMWLAACLNADAAGVALRRAACQDHPALWHACMREGLCDVRDINDLLMRTLAADEVHAAGRLARAIAPLLGREPPPRAQR